MDNINWIFWVKFTKLPQNFTYNKNKDKSIWEWRRNFHFSFVIY